MKTLLRFAGDLWWMMYPRLCAACGRPLFTGEVCICTLCRYHLPRTGFHLQPGNPVEKHFWGRSRIRRATAQYFFSKGQRVQRLVHQLKYNGRKDVGEFIGELMGRELFNSPFGETDCIVPVPLHASRLKKRGYNQSDCIADGLSVGLQKPSIPDALERTSASSTQTRKHRYERFQNVDNIFRVAKPEVLSGRNVLLVDDVITTGSTLISCTEALLEVPGITVSIAALACA